MAAHLRALELPVTILRPMAFMELMAERKFFPPASTWHLMPKLMGATRVAEAEEGHWGPSATGQSIGLGRLHRPLLDANAASVGDGDRSTPNGVG